MSAGLKIVRDTMLYEVCPLCQGTGNMPADHKGFVRACHCRPLRVVAVGVSIDQLEGLVRRDRVRRGDPGIAAKPRKGGE